MEKEAEDAFRRWIMGPSFESACRGASHACGWGSRIRDLRPELAAMQCKLGRELARIFGVSVAPHSIDASGSTREWRLRMGPAFEIGVGATKDLFSLPEALAPAMRAASSPPFVCDDLSPFDPYSEGNDDYWGHDDCTFCVLHVSAMEGGRPCGWTHRDLKNLSDGIYINAETRSEAAHACRIAASIPFIASVGVNACGIRLADLNLIDQCKEVLGFLWEIKTLRMVFEEAERLLR